MAMASAKRGPSGRDASALARRGTGTGGGALRDGKHSPGQQLTSKLFSFLTNVALLALWRSLMVVSVPLGKVIALNLWLGKSMLTVSIHLQHQVRGCARVGGVEGRAPPPSFRHTRRTLHPPPPQILKAIGWLSSPALPPYTRMARAYKRNVGADVKNWHVGVGERAHDGLPPLHGHGACLRGNRFFVLI